MFEDYSHWHTDMTISRDDDPGDHPDPDRATPGTAADWSDDDGPRWTTDPCVTGRDDDEAQARLGDADDLFTY